MDLPLLSGSRRLDWEQLPGAVRQALQARLRSPVVHASTQPGGFSPGLAARLQLADGRRVFVKAAGPDPNPNPHTPALHRAEAHITAALPATAPSPRLLWSYDQHGWVALAFEDIEGKLPTLPWQLGELQRVLGAVAELATTPTPAPAAAPSIATRLGEAFCGWQRLAAAAELGHVVAAGLDPWACRHLDRLGALEQTWPLAALRDGCSASTWSARDGIWPAHVRCCVGPDGSRRIQKDRLDDHRDGQGASAKESDAPLGPPTASQ